MLAEVTEQLTGSLFVFDDEAMAAGHENPDTAGDLVLTHVAVVRRREGLGTAAVEALADAAWERGMRTMSVWTTEPAFLEAIGFTRTGRARDASDELTAELEAPVREIVIAEGIRLGQLLKLAELVETGAEAKALLAEEAVEVNGEVESRRGRQLADGDEVRARDQAVRVVLVSPR
jgi:ribosome-associated protein